MRWSHLRICNSYLWQLFLFEPSARNVSASAYCKIQLMKKTTLISCCLYLLLIVYCVPVQSCSKYTIVTSQKNPADIHFKKKVAASYLWGLVNKPQYVIDTACGKAGLSEVKVTTNVGYSLIHIVTLGIVNIVKVEWKCQKEEPVIGFQP